MKHRSATGQFIRQAQLARRHAAARLGEHEERTITPSPAPSLTHEELAQQLAQDPEFLDWQRSEQLADLFSKGTR